MDVNPAIGGAPALTLLYDGGCPLCLREVRFLRSRDQERHRMAFVDIDDPDYDPSSHAGIGYREAMGRIHAPPPFHPAGSGGEHAGGKTHLFRLVHSIETGERSEVVIARNGRPVARLTSLRPAIQQRRLGVAKRSFHAPASIDDDNPLILDLFEQP